MKKQNDTIYVKELLKSSPSFKMAMIRTMNGAKSYFHIKAINMNPNCQTEKHKLKRNISTSK